MRKNGLKPVKKAKCGGLKFQKIHDTCQFKLLNVKEVLKFDAMPQHEQHTLPIFLKHWKCQLLVQNILSELQELFTEFLHNIPTGRNNPKNKMKRNGYVTIARPANKNDILTRKIKWDIRLPKQKHLTVPEMLYNYIFLLF